MPETFDPVLIRHLTAKNLLSFAPDNEGIDLKALNVLIGPNGSGKSNLIEAVSLMRAAAKEWIEVTRRGGGVKEWIWKGDLKGVASVEWTVRKASRQPQPLRHTMAFDASGQSFVLRDERIENEVPDTGKTDPLFFYKFQDGNPVINKMQVDLPSSSNRKQRGLQREAIDITKSIVAQRNDPELYPEIARLSYVYPKIRIYREWAFGRDTIFRAPHQADGRRDYLEEDFSNLGLFLNRIKTEFPAAKRAILKGLQDLYEGISDFEVNTNSGTVQVFLHEGDFAIPATRLSDGTLRYLCLLAILCDPEPPPLTCIEEPELGLHPDILPNLADLLRAASERTQIIITTHSDILVDAMTETPECVVVCEKHDGKTEMKRLESADLTEWLKKYRLGALWTSGQLGGNRW
ncbi:MAG: AAA family ATPase [Prosthecobacter sp.]